MAFASHSFCQCLEAYLTPWLQGLLIVSCVRLFQKPFEKHEQVTLTVSSLSKNIFQKNSNLLETYKKSGVLRLEKEDAGQRSYLCLLGAQCDLTPVGAFI